MKNIKSKRVSRERQDELRRFSPLLNFANNESGEDWKELLIEAMGNERLCSALVVKNGKTHKMVIEPGELPVMINKDGEWDVRIGGKCCGGELLAWEPTLPKVLGEEPTLPRVRQLRQTVRDILSLIVEKAELIETQRAGKGDDSWKRRDHSITLVEVVPPYREYRHVHEINDDMHWFETHFEEYKEILKTIEKYFGGNIQRKAVVIPSGIYLFEDHGMDASKTLLFKLASLTEEIFSREEVLLKKCPYTVCERFFLHDNRRPRRFCREQCRRAYHNKRWVETGKARDYMREHGEKYDRPYKGTRNDGKSYGV